MANPQNLKPFTGANDPRRANGPPKGSKHISTWIQQMLNDEDFEANILDSKLGVVEYKGAPLKAIIGVAVQKAIHDPASGAKWAEWLAKYGWGSKVDVTSGGDKIQGATIVFGDSTAATNNDSEVS